MTDSRRSRRSALVLLATFAASACDRTPDAGRAPAHGADSMWVEEVEWLDGLRSDTVSGGIFMAAGPGRLAILPMNQPGITIIDSATGRIGTIGERAGAGPGEFQGPVSLWFVADTLVVYDRALSRISVVGPDNAVVRTRQLTQSPDAVYGSRAGSQLASARGEFLGSIIRPDSGEAIAHLPRTAPRARGSLDRYAAGDSGTFFVYEATTGLLHSFDSTGNTLAKAPIPTWLATLLLEQFDRHNPPGKLHLPQRFPEAKFLVPDPAGGVWLFYFLGRMDGGFAVRYDPGRGSFTKVGLPADSATAEFLKRAFAAAIIDSVLFVSRPEGTRSFVIRGRR